MKSAKRQTKQQKNTSRSAAHVCLLSPEICARSEATVIACSLRLAAHATHNLACARSTTTHSNSPCQALRLTIPLLRAAAAAASQPLSLYRLFFTPVLNVPCLFARFRWPTRKKRAERRGGREEEKGGTEDARARKRASQRVMCACCAPAAVAAAAAL